MPAKERQASNYTKRHLAAKFLFYIVTKFCLIFRFINLQRFDMWQKMN